MVMVVADPVLEPSRRPGGLNAADESCGDQDAESVINRLQRDGADLRLGDVGDDVGRDVRLTGDGPQHRQPLSRNLDAVFAQEACWVCSHGDRVDQFFD